VNLNINATLDIDLDQATFDLSGRMPAHAQLPEAPCLPTLDRVPTVGVGNHLPRERVVALPSIRLVSTHARGSAMEAAAALDTMRVMKLVSETSYTRGIELLEGIVAMLTKMT
jgi:hypothetical protein